MKTELRIRWQRLLDEANQTCPRCGITEAEIERAVNLLRQSLSALGIQVILEKEALNREEFSADPLQSNRIWIAGKTIEEWLSAGTGKSQCCSACGDSDCRTMIVDGRTYEAIPAELIIKAGMIAGAQMVQSGTADSCCGSEGPPAAGALSCLPSSPCGCK